MVVNKQYMDNPKVGGRKIRRLFYDLEVSPNVVLSWQIGYKVRIGDESIVAERKVICIAFKFQGEKKTTVLRWSKDQDDTDLLREFSKVANEADEVVAHKGDTFDLPWFRARLAILGLDPIPPYKTIDTCAWAMKYFRFNCAKLNYLAQIFKIGSKSPTGYGLWREVVLDNSQSALDKMCAYCKNDIFLLEGVYNRLLRYCPVKPKTHAGVHSGGEKWSSPRDGSTNVIKHKTRVSATGTVTHQMQSLSDGSYFSINDSAFKAYLKAKKND